MDGDWYLFAGDDSMLTGWQSVGGRWYYLTPSGRMATGWVQDNGKWYYLDDGGSMRTGWVFSGGEWYFLDGTGAWNLEDPEMTAYAQGFSSATDWLILIDTKENQMGVFRGSYGNWKCEYLWRCSCGTAWTPTVLGTYSVTGRGYSFGSSTYTCYYYTQFWATTSSTPSSITRTARWRTRLAEGCRRVACAWTSTTPNGSTTTFPTGRRCTTTRAFAVVRGLRAACVEIPSFESVRFVFPNPAGEPRLII